MQWLFYVAAAVAIVSTVLMLTRLNGVHALLYLIVSLLAVSVVFFVLGAPFVAALEVIIYAGAIMVLFVFVVMLLNLGRQAIEQESRWLSPGVWVGPIILAAILIAEVAFLAGRLNGPQSGGTLVGPRAVGMALYGPYLMGVELASFLLLGALIGAYHLGVRPRQKMAEDNDNHTHEPGIAAGGDLVRAGADRPTGTP
ncbi:MAG: NADH-quinone oxidoreductase subunit J [Terriglobia bacterium]